LNNNPRGRRGWNKGSKGNKKEKYFFRVKALQMKEWLFRQDLTSLGPFLFCFYKEIKGIP
jgi:hypothetical protein